MVSLILKKPIKITISTPDGLAPEYELIGKLIDNIIVMADSQKLSLDEVGKIYSCEFVVGKKNKYKADFLIEKTMYHLKIGYIKELTKFEASRSFAVPPKEKAMVEEAKKQAMEQVKEKEKQDKKDKVLKALAKKKKEVKKNEFSDLD